MAEDPSLQDAGQANRNKETPVAGSEPHPTENIIRPARQRSARPAQSSKYPGRRRSMS